ncbi:DUF1302 domain-containing protein [Lysobacter sp. KIS68-7]|uniref:DUF1302 domain-containing protein n=1 Tax=Lysobacter sp. KIS68-7 TaxID=2904252 RepID=UPI001E35046A|nr:DUF1302 domain-containing protein [Lysobacter sp. KIS68-7]UHQ20037.1 DUF1302 domain-containing protein [Lysobacter sp. KIS68-7]
MSKRLLGTVIAASLAAMGTAGAAEIKTSNPDVTMRWDNTLRFNLAQRVEGQDANILNSANYDDGDRNFDKGLVSARFDLLSEFDFIWKDRYGFRISGAGWYDAAYEDLDNNHLVSSNHIVQDRQALGLSHQTDNYFRGPGGEILDAFAFAKFDIGDMPVNVKAGRHTVFWGEAMLSPVHSLSYGQSALDLGKQFSVPGTEAKELFLPRNAVSIQLQATPELSFAAQYFLDWEQARIPEAGSFLGFNDYLLRGGESFIFGPAAVTPRNPNGVNLLRRGADVTPDKTGDWGVNARWSPSWLDGTIGLYYRETADILPQGYALPAVRPGTPAALCSALGLTPLGATTCYINPSAATVPQILSGNIGQYGTAYADGIKISGLSLSKNLWGTSVGAEVNYRENMPLLSDTYSVLPASLARLAPVLPAGTLFGMPESGNSGGARGNTWHGVLNTFSTFSENSVWDSANLIVELTWNHWSDVTQNAGVFKGRSNYTVVGPNGALVTPQDKVTKDFYGIAFNFTPTKFQMFPGADISMPISFSRGLSGNSAVLLGGNEGAGSYSIGVAMDLQSKYRFDLKYVDFMGDTTLNTAGAISSNAGANSLLTDRGFLAFTFKTTL